MSSIPDMTMPVTGYTLSRILREVETERILVELLTLRVQDGNRIPVIRVMRQSSKVIAEAYHTPRSSSF